MNAAPLLIAFIALSFFCQCQSGYQPDFVAHPTQLSLGAPSSPEHIAVYARPPGVYKEMGPVSAKHNRLLSVSRRSQWERALRQMKEQAATMGADAIIVPQLSVYDRAATTEGYLGLEGGFTPGPASAQLKPNKHLHGIAIRLPHS